jgi:hypothetical protein
MDTKKKRVRWFRGIDGTPVSSIRRIPSRKHFRLGYHHGQRAVVEQEDTVGVRPPRKQVRTKTNF